MRDSELGRSMAFFPLVGLVIGGLTSGIDWAARGLWPPSIAGVVAVVFLALLTRGLHLDGLADTADAVASGADRERALEIMRDSTNGALGILAMVLVLMIKAVCAVQLSTHAAWQWFVLIPCFSRTGIVLLGAISEYARPSGGLGSPFAGRGVSRNLLLALPTTIAAAWTLAEATGVAMLAGVVAMSAIASLWARRRFGGTTGDILGAHVELQEALLFLASAAVTGA